MSLESPRIHDLRRRVESDPAPFVYAQLAEEYRRAGRHEDALACCREGLDRHPTYLSLRLILGRALAETGALDEAAEALEDVLRGAPDNLSATRDLAEIRLRQGNLEQALAHFERALDLFRHDAGLEGRVRELSRQLGRELPAESPRLGPAAGRPMDFDGLLSTMGAADAPLPPLMEMLLTRPIAAGEDIDVIESADNARSAAARVEQRMLAELEAWLTALRRSDLAAPEL